MIEKFSVEKLIIKQKLVNKFIRDLDDAKRDYEKECQNLAKDHPDFWLHTPEQFIYKYAGDFYLVNLDIEEGHHRVEKIEQLI